jgi:hypothetical protein
LQNSAALLELKGFLTVRRNMTSGKQNPEDRDISERIEHGRREWIQEQKEESRRETERLEREKKRESDE